jgi:hypothetical protein
METKNLDIYGSEPLLWSRAQAEGSLIVAPSSAASAGPAPWDLYEVTLTQAIAVATGEPFGATRWRFSQ